MRALNDDNSAASSAGDELRARLPPDRVERGVAFGGMAGVGKRGVVRKRGGIRKLETEPTKHAPEIVGKFFLGGANA